MAEFAKEAMSRQRLDGDEIISVKWAETDQFELSFEDHKEIVENVKEQKKKKGELLDEKGIYYQQIHNIKQIIKLT